MNSRIKMSEYLHNTKHNNGQFDQLSLDKKNKVLQRQRLL